MKGFWMMLFFSMLIQCRNKEQYPDTQFSGAHAVPSSIKEEHEYLLEKIQKISQYEDSTGNVAKKLNVLMQHHFQEEEDFVLPPLTLLPLLASGRIPEDAGEIILLSQRLKSQLMHMDAEHQMIMAHMKELLQAADFDNHAEIAEFERELRKHASYEEEVFFPAAILVGDYLVLKASR